MSYGDETVIFLEIDQPLCSLTYGTAPCAAVLGTTGAAKCYNSRVTCQDAANYTPGTLTLRFARPQESLLQYGAVIPSLESVDTTPGSINLAAMDQGASALGQREVVTAVLLDHWHSDLQVDKYRLERATGAASDPSVPFDPYEQGTFWGKWLARNPYHSAYNCRVREGVVGQALADMRVRHYVIDRIEGPTDGSVKLVAKDLFSRIEARKAVAPTASTGELSADISAVAGSATLAPAGVGNLEYPAAGYVAFGDECAAFTRSGDVLTLTARGALSTVAAEHKAEDLVQVVLSFEAQLGHDIVYDLLTLYSEIPAANIDKNEWDALASSITDLFTGRITEPTPVDDLIGELCVQAGFTIWNDVSTGMIEFAALRAKAVSPTVNDDAWIVDGSLSVKRQHAKRVSQVWVYYGQMNPTKDLKDRRNYHSRMVTIDPSAEGATQYGVPVIREFFSRWIPQFGRDSATRLGERTLTMFRDPPLEAEFKLHASRDGELSYARYFSIETAEVQDFTGAVKAVAMAAVEIERGENEIGIRAQGVAFSADTSDGVRRLYIENDSWNLNLRTIHDTLFSAPVGTEIIEVIVLAGITVGSTSTASPAMRTGSWPTGIALSLVTAGGRIQGRGGDGDEAAFPSGTAGHIGGDALLAEFAISIDNTDGEIWSGGGGGAGDEQSFIGDETLGGGGGGGAGTNPGLRGSDFGVVTPSQDGTTEAGGAGGYTGFSNGGNGGGPGIAGSANSSASASGGAAGNYIAGNSFVTWVANGDRRGGVA